MRARLSLTLLPVAFACCLLPATAQEKPQEPFETRYEVIVPGLVGNSPYILEFRSANLRVAVRDLIMGHGEARDVPTRARAVMELRGGSVITTINGVRTRRRQGDISPKGNVLIVTGNSCHHFVPPPVACPREPLHKSDRPRCVRRRVGCEPARRSRCGTSMRSAGEADGRRRAQPEGLMAVATGRTCAEVP